MLFLAFIEIKGDYAQTRASDFKHLPAVNPSNFLVDIGIMFKFNIPTYQLKFHHFFGTIL